MIRTTNLLKRLFREQFALAHACKQDPQDDSAEILPCSIHPFTALESAEAVVGAIAGRSVAEVRRDSLAACAEDATPKAPDLEL